METATSICQRFRYSYCGRQKVGRIITPALTIGLIILVIRWAASPTVVHIPDNPGRKFATLDEGEIAEYLNGMSDARTQVCLYAKYGDFIGETISIILDFHEEQFYDLKLTMESILRHTEDHQIHEIILLDDGTGSEAVQKHAARYLAQEKFKKVIAYRSEKSEGSSLSRFKASKVATGSILVFLSSHVAVNKGWLEPLVDAVISNRHMMAVPHFDSLLHGGRFFRTPDNLVNVFSWTLDTFFTESTAEGRMLPSPVMTGDAFAVDRAFLDSIGSFDEFMDKGFGENLELSIRTWLCGGSISVLTCSRVAVRDALKPVRVQSARNFRRITELWLDNYKGVVYKQGEFGRDGDDEPERFALKTRKQHLAKITTCRPFEVYLKETAKQVIIPTGDARYFGKIKAKTGYCLTSEPIPGPQETMDIAMVLCNPHMYSTDMIFELDYKGRIRNRGQCIEIVSGAENLELAACQVGKSSQIFELLENGLISSLQKSEMCLVHASGTQGGKKVNYVALKKCPKGRTDEDRDFLWSVIKY